MNNLKSKLVNYLILGMLLILTITLVKNVVRTNQIRAQIEGEKSKIAKIQEENNKIASEIAKTQSADFIEKEMRDKLGLGMTGEAMVVLPDAEMLKKLAPEITVEVDNLPDPNWKKWVHLFTSK